MQQITRQNILRVLILGFALVTVLLLAAGFIGVKNLHAIKENAASLVEEQFVTTRLIDEVQREQGTLSAVFYHMEQGSDSVDRAGILSQLNEADKNIDRIVSSIPGRREILWEDLRTAATSFSQEAHRLHGEVGSTIASSLRDPTQEVPTGAAHLNLALLCRVSSVAAPALRAARPLWRQAE